MRSFLAVLAALIFTTGSALADKKSETLDALFLFLTQGERAFINEVPGIMGFEGNSIGVYADHLTKTWQDDTLRNYLSTQLGPASEWKADGNIELDSFENILVLMPLGLSRKSDIGAFRLGDAPKAQYIQALHSAFRVEAQKGLEPCLSASIQEFGKDPDAIYKSAGHKLTLMKNMDAKTLQAYLQIQRQAVLAELEGSGEIARLDEAGLEATFAVVDPILDTLVSDHPNKKNINDFWFNGIDEPQTRCDVNVLEWSVLDQLQDDNLALVGQYYLEVFNGAH